ncbi:MAG: hypothetical protein WCH39_06195 [Schlesneria sp.]
MPLSVIQSTAGKQGTAGNGLSITFGSSVTAGNTILVAICSYGPDIPVVTDNLGNVYVCDFRASSTANAVGNSSTHIFRAQSVVGGSCTFTILNNCNVVSTQFWSAGAVECSPVIPTAQSAGGYATTGTAATAGAITTGSANSLVIGTCGSFGATVPVLSTTGFTSFGPSGTAAYVAFDCAYQLYSSIQSSLNMTWTVSSSSWFAGSMAYVSAPSSGGGVPLIGEGLVFN